MTVRELIEELEDMPQDVPVVTDYQEIKHVHYNENFYYLNNTIPNGYVVEPAVVLE